MKRKIILAAAILALLAVSCIAIGWACVPPEWRPVEEFPRVETDSPWNLRAEFAGLETISGDGLAWDSLTLRMGSTEGNSLDFYDDLVLVDYMFLGRWMNVYEGRHYYGVYRSFEDIEGPVDVRLRVPAGTFGKSGRYRARLIKKDWQTGEEREAGRCSFRISEPTREVEGTAFNDFSGWYRLDGHEDYIDETITLTSRRLFTEDRTARLEFTLVPERDIYTCNAEFRVDILWQGEWYCVSPPYAVPAYAGFCRCVPKQEYIMTQEVPRQVLGHPGTYRLYWGGAAYCEFTV